MVRLPSRRERDLAQMETPSPVNWPVYPFLPLSRDQGDEFPELGLLYDASGVSGNLEHQTTVFLLNLFDIAEFFPCEQMLFKQKQIRYETLAAILDDGWRVD